MTIDAASYADQLLQLLPPGRAWSRDRGSVLAQLIGGMAEEFARVDARAGVLVDEADPRTALELLPEWERVAGLPDTCTGRPDNVGERQIALAVKLAAQGGQSIRYFTSLAEQLGYFVEITETSPAAIGMRCDGRLNGEPWAFAWRVEVLVSAEDFRNRFAVADCNSRLGVRLRGYSALDIECLIRRAKPAHTSVMFSYTIEPDPVFWFDFTQGY